MTEPEPLEEIEGSLLFHVLAAAPLADPRATLAHLTAHPPAPLLRTAHHAHILALAFERSGQLSRTAYNPQQEGDEDEGEL